MAYHDQLARESFKNSKNVVVAWILMASYLYYLCDESILSDEVFDKMCKWLYANFDEVEHRHKYLIKKEDLSAGSLYQLQDWDYPNIVKGAAR